MRGLNLPKKHIYLGPASIVRRLIAFIIDLFIIDAVIVGPFRNILASVIPQTTSISGLKSLIGANNAVMAQIGGIMLAISILTLLYFSLMQSIVSQTVGMMMLNIFVIRAEKKISKPGFWQCIIRNAFILPFFPFFVLWLTEPLFLLFSRSRMRMLEVLSKTATVEEITS